MTMCAISHQCEGTLLANEPMGKHTSWRVGGPAEWYFKPSNLNDLSHFLRELPPELPVTWIGLGSNVLVRDGGIRGVVIGTHGVLSKIERLDDARVYVESGVACAKVARQCSRWGLGPAEFFAGIPGTVGGALAMNAGAFGGETWQCVDQVQLIDRQGALSTWKSGDFDVSYRQVSMPQPGWYVAAWLQFNTASPTDGDEIRNLLVKRKQTQPIGLPSCGSVFRNPENDYAARLIQAAGLRGYAIGGAHVSDKHTNFIINDGTATAADIEALIDHVMSQVRSEFGIKLIPEVRIVGEVH